MEQAIGRTIGTQIRALRKARGVTQDELAQAASVPQGNISRLERGDVHDVLVSTLLDLAKALHVDAMTLLQPVAASATKTAAKRQPPGKTTAAPGQAAPAAVKRPRGRQRQQEDAHARAV